MRIMDLEVDSRPALFLRLLGSTVDTSSCVSLRGCLAGHDAPRAGFLRCPQAPDARRHGRHGPEGQFSAGFLVAFPQVQLMFFHVVHMPVVCNDRCLWCSRQCRRSSWTWLPVAVLCYDMCPWCLRQCRRSSQLQVRRPLWCLSQSLCFYTIVATATGVASYSSSADCFGSAAPLCC